MVPSALDCRGTTKVSPNASRPVACTTPTSYVVASALASLAWTSSSSPDDGGNSCVACHWPRPLAPCPTSRAASAARPAARMAPGQTRAARGRRPPSCCRRVMMIMVGEGSALAISMVALCHWQRGTRCPHTPSGEFRHEVRLNHPPQRPPGPFRALQWRARGWP